MRFDPCGKTGSRSHARTHSAVHAERNQTWLAGTPRRLPAASGALESAVRTARRQPKKLIRDGTRIIYRGPRVHKGPRGAPGVQWSKGPQGQRVPRVKGSTRVPRVKRSTGVQGSTRVPRVKGSTKVHRPLDPWTPRSLDPWSPCPGPGPAHGLSAACYVSYKLRSLQFRSVCVVLALPCCSSLLSAKLKTDNAQESNNY